MFHTPLRQFAIAFFVVLVALLFIMVAAEHRGPGGFLPHGYCFTWNPTLLWVHVSSDSLIGAAYVSIPLTLIHLVRKRADLPFNWIVVLFATFIVSCGMTHWIEVWTVWNPDYWLSAMVKMITATASVLTAAALIYLVPRILAIPTIDALNIAKADLEAEVQRRVAVEEALRAKGAELEMRVEERTAELALATDEAQAAQAEAHQANLQKDRFLAKVSHELRTPLQSTLTWVAVLQAKGVDPSRIPVAIERISHNVAVQSRLIDDLLDISRILSGKLVLEWRMADPIKVIAQAVAVVQDARPDARIKFDFSSSQAEIRTDAARLEQVAWNLINNAVQASEPEGQIVVSLRVSDVRLNLDVTDSGRGISVDDLPTIFEPFLQSNSAGNQHRGLGLGLAIVRSIVRLLGGDIRAYSQGLGTGARFSVVLPVSPNDAAIAPTREQTLDSMDVGGLRGLRVLYVEDEEEIAKGVGLLLSDLGISASVCTTFDGAVSMLRTHQFDLLVTDLMLDSGHSGRELMPVLQECNPKTPAIVLSAFGRQDDRLQSMADGFVNHLVKPIGMPVLVQALLLATGTRPTPLGDE